MTKKKFLADLDKRLYILDESERTDIINEYNDIIDEKIKHGTLEKDAISEFGNIDSLVEEILKAYKINTKYKSTDAKIKDAANKSEDFIKKAAKGLSEITNDVIDEVKKSNLEISSENVFEIVIKVLILLLGLSILRLPFYLVGELGESILSNNIFPFMVLPYLWSLIVWIFYIISCVLIVVVVFKDYFFKKETVKTVPEVTEKKSKKINKIIEEEKIVDEPKLREIKEKTNNALMIIVQIFLVFTFFIPVIAFLTGFSAVLAIATYLLIKGINTVGIIILTLGVFAITGFFIDLVSTLFSKNKKVQPYSLVAGFVMVIVGILFTIEMAVGFDYINTIPADFKQNKSVVTYQDASNLEIDLDFMKYEKITDQTMENGHVVIELFYYSDYVKINRIEERSRVSFNITDMKKNPSQLIKSVIKELKNDRVYSYHDLFIPKVKIYANNNTLDSINITRE